VNNFLNNFEQSIIVRESDIHGKGLFSSIFIPAGEQIMLIKGETISGEECERRENEEENVYIFWNGDDCFIDTSATEKIKYINHNCEYNCDVADNDEESLILIASRNIMPGDELTIDYGYEEIYEECNCSFCMSTAQSA
jgi:uncharacterized protein